MAKKYRIAVVGCGNVSTGHIESWLSQSQHVEVAGLFDIVPKFCHEKKERYRLDRAVIYDSYEQVLADDRIDIVNVCAMSDTHFDLITRAMDAGKHVLTEKPTGYNLEECRHLRWYARKSPKLKVAVAYSLRYIPINIAVRKLVRDGAIGQPMFAHIEHCHQGHASAPAERMGDWGIDRATDRGGRYICGSDMTGSTHPFDLARYMLGEPREVYAARNACGTFVTITFVDEAICQVIGARTAQEGLNWVAPVVIQGTAGTIYTTRIATVKGKQAEHVAFLMNNKNKGARLRRITARGDTSHGDHTRAKNFVDALRKGTPLICGLEDGVRTSELLHAIWNSYSLGIRVPIQRAQKTG